jgi:putative aldouronate transport system permease protein
MIRKNTSRKLFIVLNTACCAALAVLCLLPLLHILAVSLSGKDAIITGKVGLLPVRFTIDNYRYVMKDQEFYTAFGVSVFRTVLALGVQVTMTFLAAYPISLGKKYFHARGFYTWFFMVAVLFNGGLIPTYLTVKNTGLLNSIWSLVLPGAVPLFYVIIMQNFIKTIPGEIYEAAVIDGTDQFGIMLRIILPLCQVSIATISLFIMVDNWNAWYDGMLYINDNNKFPLQTYLRGIVVVTDMKQLMDINSIAKLVASQGADAAKIFIAIIPVLAVYPFVQKHFVKGIVIGSVKG